MIGICMGNCWDGFIIQNHQTQQTHQISKIPRSCIFKIYRIIQNGSYIQCVFLDNPTWCKPRRSGSLGSPNLAQQKGSRLKSVSSLAASTLSVWLQAACRALTFGHLCVISGCKPHGDRVQTRDVNYCTRATRHYHVARHNPIISKPLFVGNYPHACAIRSEYINHKTNKSLGRIRWWNWQKLISKLINPQKTSKSPDDRDIHWQLLGWFYHPKPSKTTNTQNLQNPKKLHFNDLSNYSERIVHKVCFVGQSDLMQTPS